MAGISRPKAARQEIAALHRGEVWLVSLDPAVSHEIKKTRPTLVIQNDVGNRYSAVTIIAAITSKLSPRLYPVEVALQPSRENGLQSLSAVRLDQIRTVDRGRLIKRLGAVNDAVMRRVDEAIRISLGLVKV